MRISPTLISISALAASFIAALGAPPAQASPPRAFLLATGVNNPMPNASLKCPDGQFLTGLAMRHTDRMVGLSIVCAGANSDGRWAGSPTRTASLGTEAPPAAPRAACVSDAYVVGFGFSTGRYSADALAGSAQPEPPDTLADLQPVCRDWVGGTHTFLDPAALVGAENNHIHNVKWDGIGAPKSCPEGEAATGIDFFFEASAGNNLPNLFVNARLLCSRLWLHANQAAESAVFGEAPDFRQFVPAGKGLQGKNEVSGTPPIGGHGGTKGEKTFTPPFDDGKRYGFCSVAGNIPTCGRDAAQRFCTMQGFKTMLTFGAAEVIDGTVSVMGNNDDCVMGCRALTAVVCRK